MSIVLVTAAFRTTLPTTPKFVLVALCDIANDQGECFPSVPLLMERCSLTDRGVQMALAKLVESGFVRREFRKGRSTLYWIADPKTWPAPVSAAEPPNDVPPEPRSPPNHVHPTPEPRSPITVKEPSIEPSRKQSGRTAEAAFLAAELPELSQRLAAEWLEVRRSKRAAILTGAAIRRAKREAEKAGLTVEQSVEFAVSVGWQAFDAKWYAERTSNDKTPRHVNGHATHHNGSGTSYAERKDAEAINAGYLIGAIPRAARQPEPETFDDLPRIA